jgi:hypothetical protein
MEPLKSIQVLEPPEFGVATAFNDIWFNIYPGPLGLMCSGGADSALMLYFTLLHSDDPIHVFTLANNPLELKNVTAATAVVNKCVQLTNKHNVVHHVVHMEGNKPDGAQVFAKMIEQVGIDIAVAQIGVTKNPPRDIRDKMNQSTSPRDKSRDNPEPTKEFTDGRLRGYPYHIYCPWTIHNKQTLANIYKKHNLLNTLFPVTYSCEYYPSDNDLPDPGMDHCGNCWWCEERQWAFGRIK